MGPIRIARTFALLAASLVAACGSPGSVGESCGSNRDCELGLYCEVTTLQCTLPPTMTDGGGLDATSISDSGPGTDSTPGFDSAVMGTDSTPGFDSAVMGTDSAVPFSLSPGIPGIDGNWACSATGSFLPAGTNTVRFDTDSGEIFDLDNGAPLRAAGTGVDGNTGIRFEVASQPAPAPAIGVFSFDAFTLPSGVTATVVGGNALGLLTCGDAHIEGVLDLRGEVLNAGPGGYGGGVGDGHPAGNGFGPDGTLGEAGVSDQTPSGSEGGGGGGGLGGSGGMGGAITDDPGAPGGGWAGMASLVPLRGGGGGGSGGGGCTAYGGGGGGAVYVGASGGVWIESSGAGINAGGGGGEGCSPSFNGGGGAGAGGMILIEAGTVVLGSGATLAANGGGGGGGSTGTAGGNGGAGLLSGTAASAGTSLGSGVGGPGGATGSCDGGAGGFAADGSGGGGGGCGRIRINTAGGSATLSGTLSPAASDADGAGAALLTEGNAASM